MSQRYNTLTIVIGMSLYKRRVSGAYGGPVGAKTLLKKMGADADATDVVTVELPNKPGKFSKGWSRTTFF